MRRIVLGWVDASGHPRKLGIPLWLPVVPVVVLGLLALALQALWASPWSPAALKTRLDELQTENARLESDLGRTSEGLGRAEAALAAYDRDSATIRELAGIPADSQATSRSGRGLFDRWFGRGDEPGERPTVTGMLAEARSLRQRGQTVERWLTDHPLEASRLPVIRPVKAGAPVVESFGRAVDPFTGLTIPIQGVGWGVPIGSPVWATGAGTVVDVTNLARWGLVVQVDHGGGYQTLYTHLSRSSVREGQIVVRGQVLGLSGNSGTTTGPRLYYVLFQGRSARDPLDYIFPDPAPTTDSAAG